MTMKLTAKHLTLLVGLSSVLIGFAPMTVAQSVDLMEKKDVYRNNPIDEPESKFGNSFNPMDLMHRANLGRSRGASEFADDTRSGISKAAEEFKQLRQQQMEQGVPSSTPNVQN